ncbi:MAG: phosphopentomutase [Clostridium sp.]|jgi:phosphopentomutase|nr:phosphopentomutase [Clostridium sp.]
MKRAIILVIDSMGCGAMPDCADYKDIPECNTLCNVAKANGGLNLPTMQKMGIGNLGNVMGVAPEKNTIAQYGIMREVSKGKDTTTGHWEIAGLVLDEPFRVYPDGFPSDVIEKFIEKTGCGGVLGNYPASGTKIIEDLNDEHHKTKFPIVYTSADSVFQIAVDVDVIPLEELYRMCRIAREILVGEHNVSRVIARPYHILDGKPTRISKDRRDYSVEPPKPTVLNEILEKGGRVVGIGKIEDIYVKSGISHAIHTGSNKEGLELTLKALNGTLELDKIRIANSQEPPKSELIFTNLVDTDMLFGHRNDWKGYGKAIEEIDAFLPLILEAMTQEDILFITADHGCDPTVPGTDHTREQVPLLVYSKSKNFEPKNLGILPTFAYIADEVKKWLF